MKPRICENREKIGDQLQNESYNLGIQVIRSLRRCLHMLATDFIFEPPGIHGKKGNANSSMSHIFHWGKIPVSQERDITFPTIEVE